MRGRTNVYAAREAEGVERTELWQRAVSFYPGYAERPIPIMVLKPTARLGEEHATAAFG